MACEAGKGREAFLMPYHKTAVEKQMQKRGQGTEKCYADQQFAAWSDRPLCEIHQ